MSPRDTGADPAGRGPRLPFNPWPFVPPGILLVVLLANLALIRAAALTGDGLVGEEYADPVSAATGGAPGAEPVGPSRSGPPAAGGEGDGGADATGGPVPPSRPDRP
ncbi:hypothetical protein L6R50_06905 [Myxococcota bacterium]|nr:hypothetical protein [Myxococcota bacterium]